MPLQICIRDDVSVATLLEVAKRFPVVRTPHVGNNALYNLLAAKCGFPSIWLDHNTPGKDWNYNPAFLIKDGRATYLFRREVGDALVSHLTSEYATPEFPAGTSLSEIHLAPMRRVFPKTRIETYTAHLARHDEVVRQVLEVVTTIEPSVWYRKAEANGRFLQCGKGCDNGIKSWDDIKDQLLVPPRTEGWVIPNVVALVIDIVVQSRAAQADDVWMLSGPDMHTYIVKIEKQLRRLYREVADRLGFSEGIKLHVVPFEFFRFTVRSGQREALDKLLRVYAHRSMESRCTHGLIAAECGDIWTPTNKRAYFTQHDLTSADDIYSPDELFNVPLWTLKALWERMFRELPSRIR